MEDVIKKLSHKTRNVLLFSSLYNFIFGNCFGGTLLPRENTGSESFNFLFTSVLEYLASSMSERREREKKGNLTLFSVLSSGYFKI